jgi:hypothetical protein
MGLVLCTYAIIAATCCPKVVSFDPEQELSNIMQENAGGGAPVWIKRLASGMVRKVLSFKGYRVTVNSFLGAFHIADVQFVSMQGEVLHWVGVFGGWHYIGCST